MSHFTHMKTSFQSLFYLEKALNRLKILHFKGSVTSNLSNIIIPQSNGSDVQFCWNGKKYDLVVDLSFWEQPYTVESFIAKISQQYASEVVISESKKIGFQPVNYHKNSDGSNTLVLERWNNNK